MKPNRSDQRSNLMAGTWMPLTLALSALALVGDGAIRIGLHKRSLRKTGVAFKMLHLATEGSYSG
jgi:hypothetical protein